MLIEKSNKANLSQSVFLRFLIKEYYPSKLSKNDIDIVRNLLYKILNDLILLKKHLEYSPYSDYSNFVTMQINDIQNIVEIINK